MERSRRILLFWAIKSRADTGSQLSMAGRGGDQRPLSPPNGRDFSNASLLFDALWREISAEGQEFSQDQESLYQTWRRLVTAMVRYWGISPLGAIVDTEQDLEIMQRAFKSQHYPEPRPLTVEENACLQWRESIARIASAEIYESPAAR